MPIATTSSPTRISDEFPSCAGVRLLAPCTRTNATSASGKLPMTSAGYSVPSSSVTRTVWARATTCALVRTSPSALTITPVPAPPVCPVEELLSSVWIVTTDGCALASRPWMSRPDDPSSRLLGGAAAGRAVAIEGQEERAGDEGGDERAARQHDRDGGPARTGRRRRFRTDVGGQRRQRAPTGTEGRRLIGGRRIGEHGPVPTRLRPAGAGGGGAALGRRLGGLTGGGTVARSAGVAEAARRSGRPTRWSAPLGTLVVARWSAHRRRWWRRPRSRVPPTPAGTAAGSAPGAAPQHSLRTTRTSRVETSNSMVATVSPPATSGQ